MSIEASRFWNGTGKSQVCVHTSSVEGDQTTEIHLLSYSVIDKERQVRQGSAKTGITRLS